MLGRVQILEVKCKGTHDMCLCDGGKRGSVFILPFCKTETEMQKETEVDVHSS